MEFGEPRGVWAATQPIPESTPDPLSAAHPGSQREKPAAHCQPDGLGRAAAPVAEDHRPPAQNWGLGWIGATAEADSGNRLLTCAFTPRPAVGRHPVPLRPRWLGGSAAAAMAPAGLVPSEVVCHGRPKKVIPFPPRKAAHPRPVRQGHCRIMIHVGRQRYALNIPCAAMVVPPEPAPAATPNRLEELQVQTRFLRLCQPAGLGDRIDGWRVCWVGGWDRSKVLFVVMAERVVRAAPT